MPSAPRIRFTNGSCASRLSNVTTTSCGSRLTGRLVRGWTNPSRSTENIAGSDGYLMSITCDSGSVLNSLSSRSITSIRCCEYCRTIRTPNSGRRLGWLSATMRG